MTVIGVDGCKGGWIAVAWDGRAGGNTATYLVAHFSEIIAMDAETIAVDMPIGLPDTARHGRGCDGDARKRLKFKASSVFPAPARSTLAARDHAEASAINRKFSDPSHGISAQAYNILRKIVEVDAVMSPTLQTRIHEVHPELCFYAMKGDACVREKKRDADGQARRTALLRKNGFPIDNVSPAVAPRRLWSQDDLIDACACAWSAKRIRDGVNLRLAADPPLDGRGLRMEINA